jgi:hypothetical protein
LRSSLSSTSIFRLLGSFFRLRRRTTQRFKQFRKIYAFIPELQFFHFPLERSLTTRYRTRPYRKARQAEKKDYGTKHLSWKTSFVQVLLCGRIVCGGSSPTRYVCHLLTTNSRKTGSSRNGSNFEFWFPLRTSNSIFFLMFSQRLSCRDTDVVNRNISLSHMVFD